ncbi:MAG: hypothetical protein JWL69_2619 [Phycisphaerales bacterium]|nr:hypothetical protein [Phycisphaerales bacterium]MDB5355276.1 hypothetical protein [Phycisphaerales bacterium]
MLKRSRSPRLGLICILAIGCAARALLAEPHVAGQDPAQANDRRMSYLDNGLIRLGVDLDLGGAITYLSTSKPGDNVVNSFDWGRQIQMSHYSGPVPFTPSGKQPRADWAGLGWNPIQVGDCYGNRSKVIEHRNDGKSIYVKCVPMQWPLNDEPGECTFECWIELKDNTAQVRSRMVNHRTDKTQYPARGQELPAVYTNGPLWRLMTYTGDKPFTHDKLVQQPAKMPWSQWEATENWAALVNDDGWGLGVWNPGTYAFIGGFAGKPGAGGPKDNPTGYIAPTNTDIIDHNIDYGFQYTLILGRLEEIRQYVYAHAQKPAPPTYRFEKDRQHWCYADATDAGWPIAGELNIALDGKHPELRGPSGFWSAKEAPILYIEAACHAAQPHGRVYWRRHDSPNFSADKSIPLELIADEKYRVYEVPLESSPEYRGSITGLRLDPVAAGGAGDFIHIKSISLRKPDW